jgi:CheY-like chemotaxis protein
MAAAAAGDKGPFSRRGRENMRRTGPWFNQILAKPVLDRAPAPINSHIMPRAAHPEHTLPPGFLMPTLSGRDELPLLGLTVLAVEDSRYACDALRLMCHRAGARLRRAETLAAAAAHLRVYRPDVVLIDLGLPDGRGESLIRDLVTTGQRPMVVLGTSGDPAGRGVALAAGADGFLDKPLESFAKFCAALRNHLPGLMPPLGEESGVRPDPLALHDDLAKAAEWLSASPDAARRGYISGFLLGVAHHAGDAALANAVAAAGSYDGFAALRRLVECRIKATSAFATKQGASPLP